MEIAKRFVDKVVKITAGIDYSSEDPTTQAQQENRSRQRRFLDGHRQPRQEQPNSHSNESALRTTQLEHHDPRATVAQPGSAESHVEGCKQMPAPGNHHTDAHADDLARSRLHKKAPTSGRKLPALPANSDSIPSRDQHQDGGSSHSVTTNPEIARQILNNYQDSAKATSSPDLESSHAKKNELITSKRMHRQESSDQKPASNERGTWHSDQPRQAAPSMMLTMPNLSKAIQESKYAESTHMNKFSLTPVHATTSSSSEHWSATNPAESGREAVRSYDARLDSKPCIPTRYTNDSHGGSGYLNSLDILHQDQDPLAYTDPQWSATVAENDDIPGGEDKENDGADESEVIDTITAEYRSVVSGAPHEEIARQEMFRDDQESKLRDILRGHDDDSVKVSKLQMHLTEYFHQYDKMKLRWEGAVDALARFRQESTSTLDDESIKAAYSQITFNVQNWVRTYCIVSTLVGPDKLTRTYLRNLTPSWREYMKNLDLRHLLFQSLLMNWLSSQVLTHEGHAGLWWAGSRQESLSVLMSQLEPAKGDRIPELLERQALEPSQVREYAAWKARTAHLVARSTKQKGVEEHINAIYAGLLKNVTSFVPAESKEKAWVELRSIIHSAVKLDEDLCKSRAFFTFHGWNDSIIGQEFNEATMEPATGLATPKPGMKVDLVLVPALWKTGTADGDMYEKLSFISKWTVICSEPPKPVVTHAARLRKPWV